MERTLYRKLLDWKEAPDRQPLVLHGARQVGKTWLLKEFGRTQFESCVYVNCDREPFASTLFADYDLGRILLAIEAHKKIAGCLACEYCHGKGNGACVQKDDMQQLSPLLAEAEALVLASPIYYFGMSAQIQAPIQRCYNVGKPAKVKKMALLLSSYSPGVYDSAVAQYKGMAAYWDVEDTGIVTAKIDEQKTDATREKLAALAGKL